MPSTPMTEISELQKPSGAPAEAASPPNAMDKKVALDKMTEALQHIEAKLLSGAPDLTPKEVLLDLSELQAKNPHLHYRWVNIRAPGKADARRGNGWLRLPETEGGREIGGELAIFVTTTRLHEHRVEQIKKLAKERLKAHVEEMQSAAEAIAKQIRSEFGIEVDTKRLFINEGG